MDKQNSKNREMLSAAIDGELSEFELLRCLKQLDAADVKEQEELLAQLGRWSLMGDLLRKDEDVALLADDDLLLKKVRDQIQRESSVPPGGVGAKSLSGSATRSRSGWLKTLGGLSVAATVAAVVVLGYQVGLPGDDGTDVEQLASSSVLGVGSESQGLQSIPTVGQPIAPYLNIDGSNMANGLNLVSVETVKPIDYLSAASDPMTQRYSAYFMLHGAIGVYQQNALLPMARVMNVSAEPSQ